MDIRKKYVEFIASILPEKVRVPMFHKREIDGEDFYFTLKAGALRTAKIEVLEKFTVSVKVKAQCAGYEYEFVHYCNMAKSPDTVLNNLKSKIASLVLESFKKDGRSDEIQRVGITEPTTTSA